MFSAIRDRRSRLRIFGAGSSKPRAQQLVEVNPGSDRIHCARDAAEPGADHGSDHVEAGTEK